jgi:uncharacterized membrane protein
MHTQRLDALDGLRGLALVWMTLFHFSFDLSQAGLWAQDFYNNPIWTWQRVAIVSLFLWCAGFSQALVVAHGQNLQRFVRRWLQVAGCAALVSLGSWWMFPKSWIYFGILHGMALMLVLVRLSLPWGRGLWLAAGLALLAKPLGAWVLQGATAAVQAWFNAPGLNWLGLITKKPVTEDYAPLVPWLGVMWLGAACAHSLRQRGSMDFLRGWPVWAPLAWLGRHSLSYYMLHQPVLIGLVALWVWLGA